ncbi:MAG: LamG-like jellyroll fold domain-containing protein, partial [Pseudomonadota bacterium]
MFSINNKILYTFAQFVLILSITSWSNLVSAQTEIRVLPLGDSITHGFDQVSYRRALWFKLQNAGYNVDFVGSHTDFVGTIPPALQDFDLDHEGHSGIEAGQLDQSLNTWLQLYDIDIVLLHIGTNDINRGQTVASTLNEMASIIAKLRNENPQVIILLAKIIPMRNTSVTAFNDAIDAWLPTQSNPNSPIILVDQFTGFDAFADNADNFHPNPDGEEKIATRWFDALQPILEDSNVPPMVEAGSNIVIADPAATANLQGMVTDDSLPSGSAVTTTWVVQSGPGTVSFDNANATTTTAMFSVAGNYVLRLTASDTQYQRSDTVAVTVNSSSGGTISPSVSDITGFWQLDENSGLNAADSSGAAANGMLMSLDNSNWQPGVYGSAICLNGQSGQEISIPTATAGLLTPSVSIAGWVMINAPLSTWAWVAAQGDNYGLFVDANGLTFYFYNGSTWRSVRHNTSEMNDGQWHHVAGSFDQATGNVDVFLNGALVNTANFQESISHTIGSGFSIGAMQGQRNFNGCLDEIQVYGRALDDSEVMTLSQPGMAPTNTAPTVNAGTDQTIQLPTNSVQMNSTITDDGLPTSPVTFSWAQISGPNMATVT